LTQGIVESAAAGRSESNTAYTTPVTDIYVAAAPRTRSYQRAVGSRPGIAPTTNTATAMTFASIVKKLKKLTMLPGGSSPRACTICVAIAATTNAAVIHRYEMTNSRRVIRGI
jgi:hypothetical protein